MSAAAFKLSAQLAGHEADVRAVASYQLSSGRQLLLSSSRDRTARLWASSLSGKGFEPVAILEGHEGFVNSCAFLPGPSGTAVALTAGQDKLIHGFQIQSNAATDSVQASPSPDYALIGHEDNVCALDVGPNGSFIVSGSWDKSAKIWKGWECVATLKGHEQAVWAVQAVDNDRVLTASADKTIKLWSISQPSVPIATFVGHTDAVRGLVLLEGGLSFASCGNDGTINLYSLAALTPKSANRPLQTLSGHTSFVYSLSTISGGKGELVSSGEDRSVRVWRDGNPVQTVIIPAISVWSVTVLSNGDIACGSSDSFVRIFTRDASRHADAEELKAYEHTISSQALNQTQVGDIKKDDLPGSEALAQPGTKEGQTKMIKNGDVVEAFQWSTVSGKWEKIGEVVGGVSSGQKKLHEGKEYDYVFDVDIEDDKPPLKLPFNLSENPYAAAQRFLEKNDLSQNYIDQVVQFIEKNTQGVSLGGSEYVDPYTGTSRYTGAPGSSSSRAAPAPPSAPSGPTYTGSGNVDPYTSSQPSSGSRPKTSILPQRGALSFKTTNFSAVKDKIVQLNDQEASKLSDAEIGQIDKVIAAIERGGSGEPIDTSVLEKVIRDWQPGNRFPALDLYRCVAAVTTGVSGIAIATDAFAASQWGDDWPASGSNESKAREVNSMLALRAIANLWSNRSTVGEVQAQGISILGSLKDTHFAKLNKNGRVAYATVLYNVTAEIVSANSKSSLSGFALDMVNEVLTHEAGDSEVLYRTLIALGNLLCSVSGASLGGAAGQQARSLVRKWASSPVGSEERIKTICAEIDSL